MAPRFCNFSIGIRFLPYKTILSSLCGPPDLNAFLCSWYWIYVRNTRNYQKYCRNKFCWHVAYSQRASSVKSEILIISLVYWWYVGFPKSSHIFLLDHSQSSTTQSIATFCSSMQDWKDGYVSFIKLQFIDNFFILLVVAIIIIAWTYLV